MRKLLYLFLLLCFTLLISCSSDKDGDTVLEPGENSTGNMYASIHGIEFTADEVRAYKQNNYTYVEGIQNFQNSSDVYGKINILIVIQDLKQPMLFGIGENGNGLLYYAHSTLTYTLKEDGSEIVYKGEYVENLSLLDITELTEKKISGTFGFRAVDDNPETQYLDIEDGRFNITF